MAKINPRRKATDAATRSARRRPRSRPNKAQLDRVPNPHRDTTYLARFTAPEFTTLCPITGQPDFAHLVIDYVPRRCAASSPNR